MKARKEKALFGDFDPDRVQQLLRIAEIAGPDPFSYSSTGFRRPLASSAFDLFAKQGTNSVRMVYADLGAKEDRERLKSKAQIGL